MGRLTVKLAMFVCAYSGDQGTHEIDLATALKKNPHNFFQRAHEGSLIIDINRLSSASSFRKLMADFWLESTIGDARVLCRDSFFSPRLTEMENQQIDTFREHSLT